MIETLIAELKTSIEANTAAIRDVLAKSGAAPVATAPAPVETPAPAKDKKAAKEPEPAPPAVVEPADDDDDEMNVKTPDELRQEITEYVRGVLQSAGPKLTEKKTQYEGIRKGYNIVKVTELADELLPEYLAKVKAEFK
jgi:ribosomal protein L12E/L44/L45/RPP1/RPP2